MEVGKLYSYAGNQVECIYYSSIIGAIVANPVGTHPFQISQDNMKPYTIYTPPKIKKTEFWIVPKKNRVYPVAVFQTKDQAHEALIKQYTTPLNEYMILETIWEE